MSSFPVDRTEGLQLKDHTDKINEVFLTDMMPVVDKLMGGPFTESAVGNNVSLTTTIDGLRCALHAFCIIPVSDDEPATIDDISMLDTEVSSEPDADDTSLVREVYISVYRPETEHASKVHGTCLESLDGALSCDDTSYLAKINGVLRLGCVAVTTFAFDAKDGLYGVARSFELVDETGETVWSSDDEPAPEGLDDAEKPREDEEDLRVTDVELLELKLAVGSLRRFL